MQLTRPAPCQLGGAVLAADPGVLRTARWRCITKVHGWGCGAAPSGRGFGWSSLPALRVVPGVTPPASRRPRVAPPCLAHQPSLRQHQHCPCRLFTRALVGEQSRLPQLQPPLTGPEQVWVVQPRRLPERHRSVVASQGCCIQHERGPVAGVTLHESAGRPTRGWSGRAQFRSSVPRHARHSTQCYADASGAW